MIGVMQAINLILFFGLPIHIEMNASYISNVTSQTDSIYDMLEYENLSNLLSTYVNYTGQPAYEPTLDLSKLKYKNHKVTWVYPIKIPIPDMEGWERIVPCITIENGTRYCTE